MTAEDILARVAAYAGFRTYRDTGLQVTEFLHPDGFTDFITRTPFRTAFDRQGDRFRFEFWTHCPNRTVWKRHLIVAAGDVARTWWDIGPREDEVPLRTAVARATGISGGTVNTIPDLLLADDSSLARLVCLNQMENGDVVGRDCYRVEGLPPYVSRRAEAQLRRVTFELTGTDVPKAVDGATVVWVETGTFLLRRVETSSRHRGGRKSPGFQTVNVTLYTPEADVPLGDEDFRFDPGPEVGPPDGLV